MTEQERKWRHYTLSVKGEPIESDEEQQARTVVEQHPTLPSAVPAPREVVETQARIDQLHSLIDSLIAKGYKPKQVHIVLEATE